MHQEIRKSKEKVLDFFGQAHKLGSCKSCFVFVLLGLLFLFLFLLPYKTCYRRMHFVTCAIYCRAPFDVWVFDTKEVFKLLLVWPSPSHFPLPLTGFFSQPQKNLESPFPGTWANFICINNKYYSYAAVHGAQLPPFPPLLLVPLLLRLLPDAWQH